MHTSSLIFALVVSHEGLDHALVGSVTVEGLSHRLPDDGMLELHNPAHLHQDVQLPENGEEMAQQGVRDISQLQAMASHETH